MLLYVLRRPPVGFFAGRPIHEDAYRSYGALPGIQPVESQEPSYIPNEGHETFIDVALVALNLIGRARIG
jgi:hypothetical protein